VRDIHFHCSHKILQETDKSQLDILVLSFYLWLMQTNKIIGGWH